MHAKAFCVLLLSALAVIALPEKRAGGPGQLLSELAAAGYTHVAVTGTSLGETITTDGQGSTIVVLTSLNGGPAVTLAPGGKGEVTTFGGNMVTILPGGGSGSGNGGNGGSSGSGGGKNGATGLAVSEPLFMDVGLALGAVGAGAMMLF
ncbi:hypothetical protein C8Q79DRAFT_1010995 [Trametes meyenii]|nr:hypothetical protein C8Q79DRAFT_1010995 [Trametes meyenii]